jgi:soluble lytic murein transglycosylase-like protein
MGAACALVGLGLITASLPASGADAQVMEIGVGQITTYDRPMVFTREGAAAIPSASRRSRAKRVSNKGLTMYDRPAVFLKDGTAVLPIYVPPPVPKARPGVIASAETRAALEAAARGAAVSSDLLEAVSWQESRHQAGVVSRAGAIGEMQLMPQTARMLGINPYDTRENYRGGAAYLSGLLRRYDGDLIRSLAAYNAGPGAVDRYGGVPPYRETQNYVASIMNRLSHHAASFSQTGE